MLAFYLIIINIKMLAPVINRRVFSRHSQSIRLLSYNFIRSVNSRPSRGDEHSLLPYLYMYQFNQDNIGYVLMEPQTKDLIAFDVGEYEKSHKVISKLEERHDA